MMRARLERMQPRERVGLALALLFAIGWAADYLVLQPFARVLRRLDEEIAAEVQTLGYHRRVMQEAPRIEAEYGAVGNLLGVATTPAEDVANMKAEIDDVARKAGLQLGPIAHREPLASASHVEYLLDIASFESSTGTLLTFLDALRSLPGLVSVEKLSLAPGAGEGGVKGSMLVTKVMRVRDA